jgi:hypothetical protein
LDQCKDGWQGNISLEKCVQYVKNENYAKPVKICCIFLEMENNPVMYVVHLHQAVIDPEARRVAAETLAVQLNTTPEIVARLLMTQGMPILKPANLQTAQYFADVFQRAGIQVQVVPFHPEGQSQTQVPTVNRQDAQQNPVQTSAMNSNLQTRSDAERSRGEMLERLQAEEDQLRANMKRQLEEEQNRSAMKHRLEEEEAQLRREMQMRVSSTIQPVPQPPVATQFSAQPQYAQQMPGQTVVVNNIINNSVSNQRQSLGFIIRALYFFFIGWWVGFAWLGVALALCVTIIGLPIAFLMFTKTSEAFFLW